MKRVASAQAQTGSSQPSQSQPEEAQPAQQPLGEAEGRPGGPVDTPSTTAAEAHADAVTTPSSPPRGLVLLDHFLSRPEPVDVQPAGVSQKVEAPEIPKPPSGSSIEPTNTVAEEEQNLGEEGEEEDPAESSDEDGKPRRRRKGTCSHQSLAQNTGMSGKRRSLEKESSTNSQAWLQEIQNSQE